jgi:hypothetical protein
VGCATGAGSLRFPPLRPRATLPPIGILNIFTAQEVQYTARAPPGLRNSPPHRSQYFSSTLCISTFLPKEKALREPPGGNALPDAPRRARFSYDDLLAI